jgi:O-antigen/teichoic acid export membrane protein
MKFHIGSRLSQVALFQLAQLCFGGLFYLIVLTKDKFDFLGKFSIAYAVFIVISNLLTLGLHEYQYSLYDKKSNKPEVFINLFLDNSIYLSVVAVFGFIICIISGTSLPIIVFLFSICLSSLNKLGFCYSNSLNRSRYSAGVQTIRAGILFLLLIFVLILSPDDYVLLAGCFFVPEFVVLVIFFREYISGRRVSRQFVLPKMVGESIKLIPHLALSELFLRVDILVLSLFVTNRLVGIYAFFAIIIEGIIQVLYGFRIYSAGQLLRIVRAINRGKRKAMLKHVKKISGISFAGAVVMICVGISFVFVIRPLNPVPIDHIEILVILSIGLLAYSMIYPFDLFLIFSGQPGWQSIYTVSVNVVNVALNLVLIPLFGLKGAATATCLSLIFASGAIPVLGTFRLGRKSQDGALFTKKTS